VWRRQEGGLNESDMAFEKSHEDLLKDKMMAQVAQMKVCDMCPYPPVLCTHHIVTFGVVASNVLPN
jgi:hypothetical protein